MAGEKCKSLYFYQVLASVIYLSLCKVTQAMPFELLSLEECQIHRRTSGHQGQVIRLPVSEQGTTKRFCRNTPAKTGLKPRAGSIQVVLGWEARTSMFSFPYRSVAKFPGTNNAVSLSYLWDQAQRCQNDAFVLQAVSKEWVEYYTSNPVTTRIHC